MGLGIPSSTKMLSDENYLVSGCRPHSCYEKAAVIVTPAGKLLMAGLIHFSLSSERGQAKCQTNGRNELRP